LKLLNDSTGHQGFGTAIIREGRMLARLRHPHVVTVYGADSVDGTVGIWMEFVNGKTLKAILAEQGSFGPQEAAVIGRDVCSALAAVHACGLIHGDVKAQNVMREAGGRIVLMDFGASDVVHAFGERPVSIAGTPAYLAPEVLSGAGHTAQSDIYSI